MKKACVTGHRPQILNQIMKYGDKNDLNFNNYLKAIYETVDEAINQGFDYFYSGGAIGVDLDFADAVFYHKSKITKGEFNINLEMALPCENQDLKWSPHDKNRYQQILKKADKTTYISKTFTYDCMQKRNEYMVDNADKVFAFWNGEKNGGTWNTIQYALQHNKEIQIIDLQSVCENKEEYSKKEVEVISEFRNDFYFLSNMFPCQIELERFGYKTVFSCVETAFQAAKSTNLNDFKTFEKLNGFEAKKLGKNIKLISNWDNVKIDIMKELITKKFTNPQLKDLLLKTNNANLIEGNTWGDTFWGVSNGKGNNHLGQILMEVRKEIQTIETKKDEINVVKDPYGNALKQVLDANKKENLRNIDFKTETMLKHGIKPLNNGKFYKGQIFEFVYNIYKANGGVEDIKPQTPQELQETARKQFEQDVQKENDSVISKGINQEQG